ncbi:MAG TPA: hypothetical protein VNK67_09725 [Burkholderiales bacterium]|nr:hypothetical protein [Burkholderiales bacterium]
MIRRVAFLMETSAKNRRFCKYRPRRRLRIMKKHIAVSPLGLAFAAAGFWRGQFDAPLPPDTSKFP